MYVCNTAKQKNLKALCRTPSCDLVNHKNKLKCEMVARSCVLTSCLVQLEGLHLATDKVTQVLGSFL